MVWLDKKLIDEAIKTHIQLKNENSSKHKGDKI